MRQGQRGIGKRKSIREVLHVEELVGDGTLFISHDCRSSFGEDGILKSVQMHAKQSSAFGWHCSAEIYTEEGVIDQDAYHLCHWKNKVTPPWGGAMGESGTFTHRKE